MKHLMRGGGRGGEEDEVELMEKLTIDSSRSVAGGTIDVLSCILRIHFEGQCMDTDPTVVEQFPILPTFQGTKTHGHSLQLTDVFLALEIVHELFRALGHCSLDDIRRLPQLCLGGMILLDQGCIRGSGEIFRTGSPLSLATAAAAAAAAGWCGLTGGCRAER